MNINNLNDRYNIERNENWRDWAVKIPAMRFDSDWDVGIVPPFMGALARFWVAKGEKAVSVYFDAFSYLGYMFDDDGNPIPYYEVLMDDTKRYMIDETEKMMADIRAYLNS